MIFVVKRVGFVYFHICHLDRFRLHSTRVTLSESPEWSAVEICLTCFHAFRNWDQHSEDYLICATMCYVHLHPLFCLQWYQMNMLPRMHCIIVTTQSTLQKHGCRRMDATVAKWECFTVLLSTFWV